MDSWTTGSCGSKRGCTLLEMKKIPLTQEKFAVVDNDDFARVNKFKWCLDTKGMRLYALRSITRRGHCHTIYLHRFILNAPKGKQVDHIDGDGLNNRKKNLRLCSSAQNKYACRRKSRSATSRFRGVCWDSARQKWKVMLTYRDRPFNLGRFDCEIAAAHAYDKKARELFGNFASPNFA
jgi:hypothetical protein